MVWLQQQCWGYGYEYEKQHVCLFSHLVYKASWLLEGSCVVHIPGHTKHSASNIPKYNLVAIISYSQTDKMLQAAEEIVGKYIWGQYDLLVMPPSFPYGGMENPCLTFVSPTLLVSYILPCYYDSCCNFKVMNWLISSSSITGWWQISCKCKQSSNLLAQREPGNEASNLHVGFTFSILSMMTYCGRLYVTTFTFSELSSTHVFTYNGQWIMPSANWHSCQYQNQSSCLYVPHYTYVYNYSCYTVTHLSNGSCQYWYMTLYE